MTTRSIAIRLGGEGAPEVKRMFDGIAESGDASAKRLARSYERAGQDVEAAIQRQAATAAKIAAIMPQTATQMRVDANAGTGFGQWEGSAKQSAAAFRELLAAEEALERQAAQLVASLNPAMAAQQRFNAEVGQAKILLDAGKISAELYGQAQAQAQARLGNATGATKRAKDAAEALATMQARVSAAGDNGFGGWEGSAQRSAVAFRELIAQEEALEQRARRLVASIDPAARAQDRFNAEVGEARALISAGVISLDQYVAKLRQEQAALDAVTGATRRGTRSVGELRAGSQQLSYQIGDVAASFGSGTPVVQIFAQQIGQTVQAIQLMTGATKGFLGFLAGPWGALITGGVIILATLAAKFFENKDAAEAAEAAARKFSDRQSDMARFIDATTGRLIQQNAALVQNAILLRQTNMQKAGGEVLSARDAAFKRVNEEATRRGTTAFAERGLSYSSPDADLSRAINDAGGNVVKLNANLRELAQRRPELRGLAQEVTGFTARAAAAYEEVNRQRGELSDLRTAASGGTVLNSKLVESQVALSTATDATARAQARLNAVQQRGAAIDAMPGGAAKQAALAQYGKDLTAAQRALDAAQEADKKTGNSRAASLARQASAMEVNARAALDLADAYLAGGAAALRAEAMRKGATDATKKGIDQEAQIRRQLAIMVGDAIVDGAKNVAQLRDETEARAAAAAQVLAGTLPMERMQDALAEEVALRPLLKLQLVAQGEQLQVLNRVIDEYRTKIRAAREEDASWAALKATRASDDRASDYRSEIADLELTPDWRRRNASKRAAVREADQGGFTGERRQSFFAARADETEAEIARDRAVAVADMLRGQQDSLALAGEELRLAAANDNVRSAALGKLQLMLDLKRAGVDPESEEGRRLIANGAALDRINAALERQRAAWEEIRGFGGELVDTLLSPDTWEDWGEGGRRVLDMLKAEFVKLALLNPIKNMLFGESNATIGSVIGNIGKLFGPSAEPVANATGTHHWSGGDMLVGEFGPEILSAPRGSRVTPANDTRRLLAANDGGRRGDNHYHFHGEGAVLGETVKGWVAEGVQLAATAGAAGGAAIGQAEMQAAGARSLGRPWR